MTKAFCYYDINKATLWRAYHVSMKVLFLEKKNVREIMDPSHQWVSFRPSARNDIIDFHVWQQKYPRYNAMKKVKKWSSYGYPNWLLKTIHTTVLQNFTTVHEKKIILHLQWNVKNSSSLSFTVVNQQAWQVIE